MCGIVGAIAEREVREILLEGLKRLEYRGYDSAGLAFISPTPNALATQINTIKTVGKVNKLVVPYPSHRQRLEAASELRILAGQHTVSRVSPTHTLTSLAPILHSFIMASSKTMRR